MKSCNSCDGPMNLDEDGNGYYECEMRCDGCGQSCCIDSDEFSDWARLIDNKIIRYTYCQDCKNETKSI